MTASPPKLGSLDELELEELLDSEDELLDSEDELLLELDDELLSTELDDELELLTAELSDEDETLDSEELEDELTGVGLPEPPQAVSTAALRAKPNKRLLEATACRSLLGASEAP